MRPEITRLFESAVFVTAIFLGVTGCGSSEISSRGGNQGSGGGAGATGQGGSGVGAAGQGASGTGGSGVGAGGTPAAGGSGNVGGQQSAAGGGGGLLLGMGGSPSSTGEVCDGIDNDGNGVVDDVDVAGDGICDCLRIGAIGLPSTNGAGTSLLNDWLNARSSVPYVNIGAQVLTPDLLKDLQVIVVLDASSQVIKRVYSDAEVTAFRDWLKQNHGVFTTSGYQSNAATEVVNANKLLIDSGIQYRGENWWGGIHPITDILHIHPITEGVNTLGLGNGDPVDEAVMGASLLLATQTGSSKGATVTIPWLRVADMGAAGRAVVWGDEWITDDKLWNSYPNIPAADLQRFWLNSIKWLTPVTECQVPIPAVIF